MLWSVQPEALGWVSVVLHPFEIWVLVFPSLGSPSSAKTQALQGGEAGLGGKQQIKFNLLRRSPIWLICQQPEKRKASSSTRAGLLLPDWIFPWTPDDFPNDHRAVLCPVPGAGCFQVSFPPGSHSRDAASGSAPELLRRCSTRAICGRLTPTGFSKSPLAVISQHHLQPPICALQADL